MSIYTFKRVKGNVEISNPQGVVLYRWTLEGNYQRAFTLHLLTKILGEKEAMRLAVQGHTVVSEIPDKKFGVYTPPEYHRITYRASWWAFIKKLFYKGETSCTHQKQSKH